MSQIVVTSPENLNFMLIHITVSTKNVLKIPFHRKLRCSMDGNPVVTFRSKPLQSERFFLEFCETKTFFKLHSKCKLRYALVIESKLSQRP